MELTAEVLNGIDGFEDGFDDLVGASLQRLVGQATFEQLGVGENNPQLIVQPMEQPRPIGL